MIYRFTIEGAAVPQGRPRLTTRGGHAHAYDPPRSREYKQYVRQSVQAQLKNIDSIEDAQNPFPLEGPVIITLAEYREPPKSWSKRRRAAALAGAVVPTTKPDMSNILKTVEDALNGVLWIDDSQIIDVHAVKRYSGESSVELSVFSAEGAEGANAPKTPRE